jgi:segregation and condensation protein B
VSTRDEPAETLRERRARTAREELEAAIEAILFVATEPVATERLYALFGEDEREAVDAALAAVIARYPGSPTQGLVADFAAGGVRLVTRPALQSYLRKFLQVTGRTKLSMAALETLAIVAYRQPITAPEIQELRSVSSTGVLKTLLDHRLVRISGRKEVVGKPFLYSTSKEFLVRFGLNRLQDLPPLEELEQMLQSQVDAEGAGGGAQTALDLRADLDPDAELERAERVQEARDLEREEREERESEDRAASERSAGEGEPGGEEAGALESDGSDLGEEADDELAGAWLEEPTDEDLDVAIAREPRQEDRLAPPILVDDLDLVEDPLDLPEPSDDEVESTVAALDWEDDDEPRSEDE